MTQPAPELIRIIEPAYGPCPEFGEDCSGFARWAPDKGHVPRGYLGATGSLDEVEVVLLINEPGDPDVPRDTFTGGNDARSFIRRATANTLRNYESRTGNLHRNMRDILDLIFPELDLALQLRKAWITETYLCSAKEPGGDVPAKCEKACASRYLADQLLLFPGRPVVALGKTKAVRRVRRLTDVVPPLDERLIEGHAAAPRDRTSARQSWCEAANRARAMIAARHKDDPKDG